MTLEPPISKISMRRLRWKAKVVSTLRYLMMYAEFAFPFLGSLRNALSSTNMAAATASATRTRRHSAGKSRKGDKRVRRSEDRARDSPQRSQASESTQQHSSSRASTPEEPWSRFFPTYEDYCLAELIQECDMNEQQADKLINLVHSCMSGHGAITFTNFFQADAAWEGHLMFADKSTRNRRARDIGPMRIRIVENDLLR